MKRWYHVQHNDLDFGKILLEDRTALAMERDGDKLTPCISPYGDLPVRDCPEASKLESAIVARSEKRRR